MHHVFTNPFQIVFNFQLKAFPKLLPSFGWINSSSYKNSCFKGKWLQNFLNGLLFSKENDLCFHFKLNRFLKDIFKTVWKPISFKKVLQNHLWQTKDLSFNSIFSEKFSNKRTIGLILFSKLLISPYEPNPFQNKLCKMDLFVKTLLFKIRIGF